MYVPMNTTFFIGIRIFTAIVPIHWYRFFGSPTVQKKSHGRCHCSLNILALLAWKAQCQVLKLSAEWNLPVIGDRHGDIVAI